MHPDSIPHNKHRKRPVRRGDQGPHSSHSGSTYEERDDSSPRFLEICWPILAGILLAILSPRLQEMLSSQEPWVTWLVFPLVVLAGRSEIGLSAELTRTLPQLMLILQFPLEGIIMVISLSRRTGYAVAIAQLVFLHLVCAFVFWLLSQPAHL